MLGDVLVVAEEFAVGTEFYFEGAAFVFPVPEKIHVCHAT